MACALYTSRANGTRPHIVNNLNATRAQGRGVAGSRCVGGSPICVLDRVLAVQASVGMFITLRRVIICFFGFAVALKSGDMGIYSCTLTMKNDLSRAFCLIKLGKNHSSPVLPHA